MPNMLSTTLLDPSLYEGREDQYCLVARLGKDETDIAVKHDEKTVEIHRNAGAADAGVPYNVVLYGDHKIAGLDEGDAAQTLADISKFAQLPHLICDGNLPSDEDCQAYVTDLVEYLVTMRLSVQKYVDDKKARVDYYEDKILKQGKKRKRAAENKNGKSKNELTVTTLDKLRQGKLYKEQDLLRSQRRLEAVDMMLQQLQGLKDTFLRSVFDSLSMEMYELVVAVASTTRTFAKKLLLYTSWDVTFGDSSCTAAHFFVRPLKASEEMPIDDIILKKLKAAGIPQAVLIADGAFMSARANTNWIGTRDAVAEQAVESARQTLNAFLLGKGWEGKNGRQATIQKTGVRADAVKAFLAGEILKSAAPDGRPKNVLRELPNLPLDAMYYPVYFRCDDQKEDICELFYDSKAERKGDFHADFKTFRMPELGEKEIQAYIGDTSGAGESPIELAVTAADKARAEPMQIQQIQMTTMHQIFKNSRGKSCTDAMARRLCLAFLAADNTEIEYQYLLAELAQCRYEGAVSKFKSDPKITKRSGVRDFERYMSVGDPESVLRDEDNSHLIKVKMQAPQRQIAALAAGIDHKFPVNSYQLLFGGPHNPDAWLDSKVLLVIAKKYTRFQPIERWLVSKVDKQNVPVGPRRLGGQGGF
jgi:hypothetical protein